MGYRKYRKTPPQRWCAECGVYVGRRWPDRVLCGPCLEAAGMEPGWTREARERRDRSRQ